MRQKELVTLRKRPLKGGGASLYLDYSVNGIRYRENLNMYLVKEKTKFDARRNEATLANAQTARAKKVIDLQEGRVRIHHRSDRDILLINYIREKREEYLGMGKASHANTLDKIANWVGSYKPRTALTAVDKPWLLGWVRHMHSGGLSDSTIFLYFSNLNTIFNKAYRADLIEHNPISKLETNERPQQPETEREYLTLDELHLLSQTPCKRDAVKNAFLFSCFTGLRLSDIERLRWENIKPSSSGGWQVEERQMKTRKIVFVPLSENALGLLPERTASKDYVWQGLPGRMHIRRLILDWVKRAGIEKHITFHCARHTNATLLLTYGADIYTVMTLMGHTDVATTQIYAKIVDAKKSAAVNMIPKL